MEPKTLFSTVAVIGGGAGGCFTALELVKTGKCKVLIFEKNEEVMIGTSNISPGRMGLGFHYADPNTAVYTLHAALKFTKLYGTCRHEYGRPESHPRRRGRYLIMKNSRVSKEDILKTYDIIKMEYSRMIEEDKSNQLFGPAENLYRVMNLSEYEDDVNMEEVDMGIETAEELLDWTKLRKIILHELTQQEKLGTIEICTQTEVLDLQKRKTTGGYIISTHDIKQEYAEQYMVDVVVNSTWYNISKINKMLGVTDVKRCNRLKNIITIELPEELYDMPSMFFCMGPYCMFSNKGNGVGMMTYALETNIAVTTSDDVEGDFAPILKPAEDKAKKIFDGVCHYVPKLKRSKIVKINSGIVQTLMGKDTFDFGCKIGDLDFIHDPLHGGIFKRDYSGVRTTDHPGYIINACMKLIYCQQNAEIVRDYIFGEENM